MSECMVFRNLSSLRGLLNGTAEDGREEWVQAEGVQHHFREVEAEPKAKSREAGVLLRMPGFTFGNRTRRLRYPRDGARR